MTVLTEHVKLTANSAFYSMYVTLISLISAYVLVYVQID